MEERARTLHLMVENDGLRVQEVQDRARIQRLLSSEGHLTHQSDSIRVGTLSHTEYMAIIVMRVIVEFSSPQIGSFRLFSVPVQSLGAVVLLRHIDDPPKNIKFKL